MRQEVIYITTFLSQFYKLTPEERLVKIGSMLDLSAADAAALQGSQSFTVGDADNMIENAIGCISVPLGIAVNFKVDGEDVFVPMATEEPSVVAAASHAAKHTYRSGGFRTSYSGSLMIGQIQITGLDTPYQSMAAIYENKEKIIALCNEQDRTLVRLGGGAKDVEVQVLETGQEKMLTVHLIVDTKDAMGANAVNTMAEAVSSYLENLTGGEVILRILSNLADRRIVRARALFEGAFAEAQEVDRFMLACQLAVIDPYRAATHNKGIMNGISAVVLATGNDTRAVEAGAHAYAARNGGYTSLTKWERGENHSVTGMIEIPLAVGLVGGATNANPAARSALKIMGAESADRLARVIASVGLAQNFAALKALAGEGIQKGHMKLHARNMAIMAGASPEQVDEVIELAREEDRYNFDDMEAFVSRLKTGREQKET